MSVLTKWQHKSIKRADVALTRRRRSNWLSEIFPYYGKMMRKGQKNAN